MLVANSSPVKTTAIRSIGDTQVVSLLTSKDLTTSNL